MSQVNTNGYDVRAIQLALATSEAIDSGNSNDPTEITVPEESTPAQQQDLFELKADEDKLARDYATGKLTKKDKKSLKNDFKKAKEDGVSAADLKLLHTECRIEEYAAIAKHLIATDIYPHQEAKYFIDEARKYYCRAHPGSESKQIFDQAMCAQLQALDLPNDTIKHFFPNFTPSALPAVSAMGGKDVLNGNNGGSSDPLFGGGGPELTDIDQSGIGDCYLLSSLGAIVHSNPNLLTDNVKNDPGGGWDVKLYSPDQKTKKLEPVWIHVNRSDSSTTSAKNHGTLWPEVYCAALAKLNDTTGFLHNPGSGYTALGEGGNGAKILQALTGQPADWASFDPQVPMSSQKLESLLANAQGGNVTAGSNDSGILNDLAKKHPGWIVGHSGATPKIKLPDGNTLSYDNGSMTISHPDGSKVSIPADHMYAVLADSHGVVYLRNPWGVRGCPQFSHMTAQMSCRNPKYLPRSSHIVSPHA